MHFRLLWSFAALLLCIVAAPRAQNDRFFQPTEGFIQAKDLPEEFTAVVRSIQLKTNDVFEGSTAHSEADAEVFAIGNKLHIESRPGTIRKRLLFLEGDTVSKELLLESEKVLRSEEFLADAIIEVKRWDDGSAHLIVTTYDQWTTTMAFTPSFVGGNFYYLAGLVESNVLGSGQRLGFFYSHGRERNMGVMEYANKSFTASKLRLSTQLGLYSDGHSAEFGLSKPLESRTDRWAFSVSGSTAEITKYVYFDANRLDLLPDSLAKRMEGKPNAIIQFGAVPSHEASASVTRSIGGKTKFNMSPTLDYRESYNHGAIYQNRLVNSLLPPDPSALRPLERLDVLGGINLSVYQYAYKTAHNYRNLKWGETVETGWSLGTKLAKNLDWLGAKNGDYYLNQSLTFINAWQDALFMTANGSMRFFLTPEGKYDNGRSELAGEVQWKPHLLTATVLSASYGGYFATERSVQYVLGEDSGLNGFPNAYYAGQAVAQFEAEQRLFPSFEFGTLVPAFALFVNAGNTFPSYDDLDLGELHYAVGLGTRLGFSKTVQKLVYHFNLSQPIGESRLDGPVFGFRVLQSL